MDRKRSVSRRAFLRAAGGGMAAYVLASCGGAPTTPAAPGATSAAPAAPGATSAPTGGARTIRLAASAAQGLVEAPQPFGFRTGPAFTRMSYLFDMLAWRDSTPDPIPWLAEKWNKSADGTQWTFTLRPNVAFQDGQPLTADDVVFSYQYIKDHATSWYSSLGEVFQQAKKIDDRTVQITLKSPYAPFLNGIAANVPVIPKHVWEKVDDPPKFADPAAFVGSGPYRMAAFNKADSSFLFVANEAYFLGKPYVQRLEYVPAGDDLVALKAGAIDMANPNITQGVANEAIAAFKNDPAYAVVQVPGEGTTALHFNLTRGEPYTKAQFRQAIVYAIDRAELVKRVLNGNGDPGSAGFLAPANPYRSPDVEPYPYDLAKAKQLLDQAGYPEQDGKRQLASGAPLVLPLLFASNLARTAEFIRDQLAKIGVGVEFKAIDPGTANQQQGEGNFDVALVTYGGLGSDPDFMRRAFNSPEQAKFWWKAWGYKNPEFARLAGAQLRALDDAQRRDLVNQMQRIVAQDVPVMPLYYPTRFLLYVPSVFDAWYFTPLWNPLPFNKQVFVTGQKTGLKIREG